MRQHPDAAFLEARRISDAIKRLDDCAACLQKNRLKIGDELYVDIVQQIYIYANFLCDCRNHGIALTDVRISEAYKEMKQFCGFLESEFNCK